MKNVFVIEIERNLSEEEIKYVKSLSESERALIIEDQKQEIISYFKSEDIEESDIKKLEVSLRY